MPPSLDETESVAVIIVDGDEGRQRMGRDRRINVRRRLSVGGSSRHVRQLPPKAPESQVSQNYGRPFNRAAQLDSTPRQRVVMMTMNATLEYLSFLFEAVETGFYKIPGSQVLARYVKSSHQNDPGRTALEIILLVFAIRTLLQSRTRADGSGKHFIKFSEKVRICSPPHVADALTNGR